VPDHVQNARVDRGLIFAGLFELSLGDLEGVAAPPLRPFFGPWYSQKRGLSFEDILHAAPRTPYGDEVFVPSPDSDDLSQLANAIKKTAPTCRRTSPHKGETRVGGAAQSQPQLGGTSMRQPAQVTLLPLGPVSQSSGSCTTPSPQNGPSLQPTSHSP